MSHVQSQVDDFGYQNNASGTAINTTTHNTMVVGCGSAAALSLPTDTYNNTWTPFAGNPVVTSGTSYYFWYCLDIVGGPSHVVTMVGGGSQKGMFVSEFSGRSKTALGNATSNLTGNGTVQTGASTAVVANADILAVAMQVYDGTGPVTWTSSTGFTIPANGFSPSANVNIPVCVEYQNNVPAATYTPSITSSYSNNGVFFVISLPPSSGAILAGASSGVARASGVLSSTPAPFAQILLNNPSHAGGSDMINMGSGPNTQTGDSAYVAFPKLIQWAADLNTMMSQLYPVRSVQAPTTGFSITPAPGVTLLVLNPVGTLAAGTIKMPPSPGDNQTFTVTTSQTITAATFNANAGQTLNGAPTTVPANTCVKWIYVAVLSAWFRLQ